jgi:hypothetical protein
MPSHDGCQVGDERVDDLKVVDPLRVVFRRHRFVQQSTCQSLTGSEKVRGPHTET